MIGRRVRTARERREWTMTELAKRAGVNHSYLSKLEVGKFGTPSVEKLTAIATALGMRLADLTGEAEPLDEDVAEAIDEVLRLAPERRREAISWIVASLQAARRVFG